MKKDRDRIFLQPSYTKFRTIEKLQQAFEEYPQQKPATPQAFDLGLVADFIDPVTKNIFSAYEIKNTFNFTIFKVKMIDGNLIIIKEDKGKFSIKIDKKL